MKKTIKEIATLWLEDKRITVKESTYSIYALNIAKHITGNFADHTHLTEEQMQKFVLEKIGAGLSVKTVRDLLMLLRSVMRYGSKKGWIKYEPWDIKYPRPTTRNEVRVFSVSEQRRLMKHLQENFSLRNLGLLVCLNTGLRIGEICALKWSDINTDTGTIHISRTIERIYSANSGTHKTSILINPPKTIYSVREIPIGSNLMKILRPLKRLANSDHFILTCSTLPLEPHTYRCYYNSLISTLGLPKLKFHSLRHTFATRCIESGCDYKTVSVLLGHSSVNITMNIYVHPNEEQKRKCIDKMLKKLG